MSAGRRHRGLRAGLALLLAAGGGCRAYAEVPDQAPTPGRHLRVRLSSAGSAAVASTIGPRGQVLEGPLLARTDSTLTLAPTVIVRASGDEERWPGDPVVLRRDAVLGMQSVRVSARRSLLLAGGVLAAMLVARQAMGGGDQVSRSPGDGGGAPR